MIKSTIAGLLVLVLTGCTALSDRASTASVRHPCGNIWNICPETTPGLVTISNVLTGKN